jgi:hypothetical protein
MPASSSASSPAGEAGADTEVPKAFKNGDQAAPGSCFSEALMPVLLAERWIPFALIPGTGPASHWDSRMCPCFHGIKSFRVEARLRVRSPASLCAGFAGRAHVGLSAHTSRQATALVSDPSARLSARRSRTWGAANQHAHDGG